MCCKKNKLFHSGQDGETPTASSQISFFEKCQNEKIPSCPHDAAYLSITNEVIIFMKNTIVMNLSIICQEKICYSVSRARKKLQYLPTGLNITPIITLNFLYSQH